MRSFLIRRVLGLLFLLWAISSLLFLLVHAMPGDASNYFMNPELGSDIAQQMRSQLGLDRPLAEQYLRWLWSFWRFDFQYSLITRRPVIEMIGEALPRTVLLIGVAYALILALALAGGIYGAYRRRSPGDHVIQGVGLALYSMPTFWLAIALSFLLTQWWPLFPISGDRSIEADGWSWGRQALDRLYHVFLPALVIALSYVVFYIRQTRTTLHEALQFDFVRTARAKGLPQIQILLRHAMRPTLISWITIFGLSLQVFVGGAVVTERVFSWPGLGSLMLDSILKRDYPVILGLGFFASVLVLLGNTLADVLCARIDPRIGESRS